MKKVSRKLVGLVVLLPLYGCNTMEGIGSDIQEAGGALEHSAAECHRDIVECQGTPVESRKNPVEYHNGHGIEYCPYCAKPIGKERKHR